MHFIGIVGLCHPGDRCNVEDIEAAVAAGIRAISRLGGPDIAAKIWDVIERKKTGK